MLTASQIKVTFPRLGDDKIAEYVGPLNAALTEYRIDTPVRIAAWLGQVGHESAELTRWVESFAYPPHRLAEMFPLRVKTYERAVELLAQGPEAVAEAVYGMRGDLGNARPGDGFLFRGRGPIQTTGRGNYTRTGMRLRLPLESKPELLEHPQDGFRAACDYWVDHALNSLADLGSIAAYRDITYRVNGTRDERRNGFNDRLRLWRQACGALGLPLPTEGA